MTLVQQKQWYRENLVLKGAIIVDVGANVGELSQFFYDSCGPKGRVISVEPHPDNIKALQKRIRKAGSKRWSLKRCAVSSTQGTVALRTMQTETGNNSMVVGSGGDIQAACLPLEKLAPRAQVIKLDVEGHEYTILPDAVPALKNVRAWTVELHMVKDEPLERTLQLFTDNGFTLIGAGQRADDDSKWLNVDVRPTLTWNDVPGKMLHVIARR